MDIDTLNQIALEDRQVRDWENQQRNRILSSSRTGEQKAKEWHKVFVPLDVSGLTEEEINQPY